MTYALVAALILLGAYAQAKNEQAKFWKELYLYSSRRMQEFGVTRDWNALEHDLAEFNELYDQNRPS
ncbi:MAG: hypothetical protein AAB669_00265 [Patescibacteria group bacterium]